MVMSTASCSLQSQCSPPPHLHSLRFCLQKVPYRILWGKVTTSDGSCLDDCEVSAVRATRGPHSQPGVGGLPEGGVLAATVFSGRTTRTMATNPVTDHLAPVKETQPPCRPAVGAAEVGGLLVGGSSASSIGSKSGRCERSQTEAQPSRGSFCLAVQGGLSACIHLHSVFLSASQLLQAH